MTDVITKQARSPRQARTSRTKQTATPRAKQAATRTSAQAPTLLIALACTHEVHELCRLASCECGCHGSHD